MSQLVWRQKDNEGSPLLRERTRQVDAAGGRRNSVSKKYFELKLGEILVKI